MVMIVITSFVFSAKPMSQSDYYYCDKISVGVPTRCMFLKRFPCHMDDYFQSYRCKNEYTETKPVGDIPILNLCLNSTCVKQGETRTVFTFDDPSLLVTTLWTNQHQLEIEGVTFDVGRLFPDLRCIIAGPYDFLDACVYMDSTQTIVAFSCQTQVYDIHCGVIYVVIYKREE